MTRVPGLDVAGLQQWLRRTHPALDAGDLSAEVIVGGRSNLTYAVEGARVPLIVRRPPLGHVLPSAHDMRREYRIISALGRTNIPVPAAVDLVDDTDGKCITGTPFFVMERAPGVVIKQRDQNAVFTHAGVRALSFELVEHLADLHAVDPASVGLADFGRPAGYLSRQMSTWRRQLNASRSRDVPALDALQARLDSSIPDPLRSAVVHGDYRLDNALVVGAGDQPHIAAILDWEMATLGDPFVDLGIFALYWDIAKLPGGFARFVPSAVDAAAGYPTVGELLDAYAERAGSAVPDLRWYRAFAAYKLAVILEGIHFRFRTGETVGTGYEHVGELVDPLAQQGSAQLG